MTKVAIIILNFEGTKDTIECLQSISKLSTDGFETQVVVVDNGSTDVSTSVISNFQFPISNKNIKLKIIRNEKNLGFSEGNNVGIRCGLESGVDYILILNNDTIVDKNLVKELLAVAQNKNDIGIVAPKIYFAKGREFHKDHYQKTDLGKVIWYAGGVVDWKNVIGRHRGVDEVDRGQYDSVGKTDFASGCCMLIKREVVERVGFFDNKYFLYYEDNDLAQRVKQSGYKILYVPKAVLWHKNAGSVGGSGSQLQDYYITRNRLLFGIRYASLRSRLSLLKESWFMLVNGRAWQKRGVLDFYLQRFGKGSYPLNS